MTRTRPLFWINAALLGPAGFSLVTAVRHSVLRGGTDLQWSGAHMAALGIDPYLDYLRGDPNHRIVLSQVPNYLHELYVLMLPLGWMSEPAAAGLWTVLNLAFLATAVLCLRRIYRLTAEKTMLLVLLTLLSAPFRIALANGQQSFFEVACVCAIFVGGGAQARGLALGLSYAKFSFSPVFFFYFALRRWRIVLISLLPVAVGLLLLWARVGGSLAHLAVEPLLVNRRGVTEGLGDLMSVCQMFAKGRLSLGATVALKYGLALGASAGVAWMLERREESAEAGRGDARREGRLDAPLLAVTSLLMCTHLSYDYVFLAIPLGAAMGMRRGAARWWVAGEVVLLWLGLQMSNHVPDARIPLLQMGVFCALMMLLGLLVWMRGEAIRTGDGLDGAERPGGDLEEIGQAPGRSAGKGALVH